MLDGRLVAVGAVGVSVTVVVVVVVVVGEGALGLGLRSGVEEAVVAVMYVSGRG